MLRFAPWARATRAATVPPPASASIEFGGGSAAGPESTVCHHGTGQRGTPGARIPARARVHPVSGGSATANRPGPEGLLTPADLRRERASLRGGLRVILDDVHRPESKTSRTRGARHGRLDGRRAFSMRPSPESKTCRTAVESTAGRIMNPEVFALAEDLSVGSAVATLQGSRKVEMVSYLYVVDEHGRLLGVVSLRRLLLMPPETPLKAIMTRDPVRAGVDTHQEDVAREVADYNLLAIPVVDEDGRLAGVSPSTTSSAPSRTRRRSFLRYL